MTPKKRKQHPALDYVRGMAKTFGSQYHGYYKWLLKRSKQRNTKPLTSAELKQVKTLIAKSGLKPKPKECYYFSQLFCLSAVNKLKYVEGFACLVIPTEHAWVEYKGKVVDAVWGAIADSGSPDRLSANPDVDYFGVAVPFDLVAKNMSEDHTASSVLPRLFKKERELNV